MSAGGRHIWAAPLQAPAQPKVVIGSTCSQSRQSSVDTENPESAVRWLRVSAGGGHGGAVPLQAPAQAQPEIPGGLPAGRGHPEGHARLHRGCAYSSAAIPGQPC